MRAPRLSGRARRAPHRVVAGPPLLVLHPSGPGGSPCQTRGMHRRIRHVDVFGATPYAGNPVAVVLDGEGLTTEQMQRFAHWTNLSETTFVLEPSAPEADYRVRIFTPVAELPFAGHPTLGTCHAWLTADGGSAGRDEFVQQCEAGLVPVRRTPTGLAFSAPPLLRSGPVEEELIERIASVLGLERAEIVDSQWVDNGPGWVAVLLADAERGARRAPRIQRTGSRRGRPLSGGIAAGLRGASLLPEGRRDGRGPGHRQPERLAGGMAASDRAREHPLRGRTGHRARALGQGRDLARQPTGRSGSEAGPSPACPASSSCNGAS